VHAVIGIGKLINIEFYAPLCPFNALKNANYDFKSMPSDYELLS